MGVVRGADVFQVVLGGGPGADGAGAQRQPLQAQHGAHHRPDAAQLPVDLRLQLLLPAVRQQGQLQRFALLPRAHGPFAVAAPQENPPAFRQHEPTGVHAPGVGQLQMQHAVAPATDGQADARLRTAALRKDPNGLGVIPGLAVPQGQAAALQTHLRPQGTVDVPLRRERAVHGGEVIPDRLGFHARQRRGKA